MEWLALEEEEEEDDDDDAGPPNPWWQDMAGWSLSLSLSSSSVNLEWAGWELGRIESIA